ncbi:10842_t:CDS:2 [Diversispora eburnea]|uniref:10842_t:CDS:1 n=1 Tax=Diversispora eburnea TaxID=1213867 RepID=A0A9N8WMT4_9GLOM|nr:10842_t:CDS:2 [Diversispora eburnea]
MLSLLLVLPLLVEFLIMENINTTKDCSFENWYDQEYSLDQYFPFVKLTNEFLNILEIKGFQNFTLLERNFIHNNLEQLVIDLQDSLLHPEYNNFDNSDNFGNSDMPDISQFIYATTNNLVDIKSSQSKCLLSFITTQLLDFEYSLSKYWEFRNDRFLRGLWNG